jgi:hypothetical protein
MTTPVRGAPAELILGAVERCLDLAATWYAWDGRPRVSEATEDIPGGTVFTPHKAIRRIADHLVDHLAQLEVLVAGAEPIPDTWHGRSVTLATDWAPFTEADLNEARNRLRRLGQVYALRLRSLDEEALDAPRGQAWTIRQIVEHVAGVTWYAEQVGRLGTPGAEGPVSTVVVTQRDRDDV